MRRSLAAAAMLLAGIAGACDTGVDATPSGETTTPTTGATNDSTSVTRPAQTAPTTAESLPSETTPSAAPAGEPLVTLPPDAPLCDSLQTVTPVGEVGTDDLVETSGIAASRTYPSVIWAHNDSGGEAIVYALATDGTLLSSHRIGDAFPLDMEDMAIGPGPDPTMDYLYLADIGDNLNFRPEVLIYRVPEPNPFTGGTTADAAKIRLRYPEVGVNSEALAVDPVTGDLFLFAKTRTDPVTIYRAQADQLFGDTPTVLEPVGIVGVEPGSEVTAADVSPNGDRIALRGYNEVWVWPRSAPDLATTLQGEPCEGASPDEIQGEALTFSPDATLLFTISEGSHKPVNQVGP